ncbi:MAG: TetR/AcrR family transcriptional regulator [Candidatus Lindowbacteria bacterium]|nr:TetR/AcrR family transcriptional regulator [Candidatus Lindowbacteria bacterium]
MTTDPTFEPLVSETRERILRAAMELFRQHGFHNTSIAQILQRAKITKGGFYFHFKSKEELGFEVLERTRDFWMENVIDAIAQEPGVRRRIKRMVEIMTEMYRGDIFHGCALLAVLTAEMMEHASEFADRIRSIIAEWQKSIVDILEQGKAEGIFRNDMDSNAVALILIGCCQGTTMMGHLDPERVDYDQLLHELERWILEGVAR